MTLVAILLAATSPLPTCAADSAVVDVRLGAATFAVPEDWIDPGYRDAALADNSDTILLVPPLAAMAAASDNAFDPAGVVAVAILLRDDPDLVWRALYVDARLAAAAAQFAIASTEDAAIAFDALLPFDALYGGPFASAGKSASRALHFVGSIPTSAHDTVAVAARIDGTSVGTAARLYSISATIRAGERNDAPLALVITLRTTRPLAAGDFALIGVAIEIANGRIGF